MSSRGGATAKRPASASTAGIITITTGVLLMKGNTQLPTSSIASDRRRSLWPASLSIHSHGRSAQLGAPKRSADDEQADDGDRRAVAEHAEHLCRRQQAQRQQQRDGSDDGDVGLDPLAHESDEQRDQDEADDQRMDTFGKDHGRVLQCENKVAAQ